MIMNMMMMTMTMMMMKTMTMMMMMKMTRIGRDIQIWPQVTATQISPSACQGGPTLLARSQTSLSQNHHHQNHQNHNGNTHAGYIPHWSKHGSASQSDGKPGPTLLFKIMTMMMMTTIIMMMIIMMVFIYRFLAQMAKNHQSSMYFFGGPWNLYVQNCLDKGGHLTL